MQQLERILNPISDGEPVAESKMHLRVIITTLLVLENYLKTIAQERNTSPEHEGLVLANQFLLYSLDGKDGHKAPDVMVIPDVPNLVNGRERDNYSVRDGSPTPIVTFEMTSQGTKQEDFYEKKNLYARLGVQEYWLFDPKAEWIKEQLIGYRLQLGNYIPITDSCSTVLGLRLEVEGLDTGEKLLNPDEQTQALQEEKQARILAEQQSFLEKQARLLAEQRAERFAERLRALGIDPDAP
jgi:Uma2 family endonuclease